MSKNIRNNRKQNHYYVSVYTFRKRNKLTETPHYILKSLPNESENTEPHIGTRRR